MSGIIPRTINNCFNFYASIMFRTFLEKNVQGWLKNINYKKYYFLLQIKTVINIGKVGTSTNGPAEPKRSLQFSVYEKCIRYGKRYSFLFITNKEIFYKKKISVKSFKMYKLLNLYKIVKNKIKSNELFEKIYYTKLRNWIFHLKFRFIQFLLK